MKFAVCGAGRVGTSLVSSLESKEWEFIGYYSTYYPEWIEKKKRIKNLTQLDKENQLIILTLPDSEIISVSRKLPPSLLIGHTSGALDYSAIQAPEPKGRFSLHPLRSIPDYRMDLSGILWGIDGDSEGLEVAGSIVKELKGKAFIIDRDKKPLYHLACMLSTNLLQTLLFTADRIFGYCGIKSNIATGLGLSTISNINKKGYIESLTGPIERGDVGTVDRNLRALEDYDSSLLQLLDELLSVNLEIAKKKGLSKDNADRIDSIISDYSDR